MNPFLERYSKLVDDAEEIPNVPLRKSIRVNTLKIAEKELVKRLEKNRVKLEKIPYLKYGYYATAPFSLATTTEYLLGYYYIQEAASQLPAEILEPEGLVMDMASAPGSKTTQLSQLMRNKGAIVALDDNAGRLVALRNNLERMGCSNVIAFKKDSRFAFDLKMQFDRILLDAPCSGNCVVDKEWFGKKTIAGIQERVRLQKELLKSGLMCLKKDGILVYSTCSMEPEENELAINWLLGKYDSIKLEKIDTIGIPAYTEIFGQQLSPEISKCRRIWPHKTGTQPFFMAKIRKISEDRKSVV